MRLPADIADSDKLDNLWRKELVSKVGLTDNRLIKNEGGG